MSLTRRNLLAAGLALPVAVALPATVFAQPATTPDSISYLSGYTMMKDLTDGDHYVGGDVELYVDGHKAIFRVSIEENGRLIAWQERVFARPEEIAMMRTMSAMLRKGAL